MKNSLRFVIPIALLAAIGAFAWHSYSDSQRKATETAAPASPIKRPPAPGEESWLVGETARDLTNLLLHAKGETKPAQVNVVTDVTEKPLAFKIRVDTLPEAQVIELQHYIWAEENYVPLAKKIIEAWKLELPVPVPNAVPQLKENLAGTLTKLDAPTMLKERLRINQGLTERPLDPGLHEQAALLLGAFAMRETAGNFSDIRAILCRMSAHLAVARATGAEAGPDGKLASVILLTLAGREVEALEKLRPLEQGQPAWAKALKLRNTSDWRILPEPGKATLLEQIEWFRAAVESVDVDFATSQFQLDPDDTRTDWMHIVIEHEFTVEDGHEFAKNSVLLELRELIATWKTVFNTPFPQPEAVKQLNTSARLALPLKSDSPVEVLGWGDWAAFYQRHLCHDIQRTVAFVRDDLGMAEASTEFQADMKDNFAGLNLYPVLAKRCAQDAQACEAALNAAGPVCAAHPELMNAANWACLANPNAYHVSTAMIPPPRKWFHESLLFGTTYDLALRHLELNSFSTEPVTVWDRVRELAPHNYDVLHFRLKSLFGGKPTAQQAEEAYGAIKDYNVNALIWISESQRSNPQAYINTVQKVCKFRPEYYLTLADYLVENNSPEEAAENFRMAFEKIPSRVMMANYSQWIVDYDFTHDRKDEAEKIASEAAETYSSSGLETMAWLREREEKLDEAEDYLVKINERYKDAGALAGFYRRHQEKEPRYATALAELSKALFPAGLEKASLVDFKTPPIDGATPTDGSYLLEKNGLHPGDVFVAIEGYRVYNIAQYNFLRGGAGDPRFTLIVWSDGKYREVKATAPRRRFECSLENYKTH